MRIDLARNEFELVSKRRDALKTSVEMRAMALNFANGMMQQQAEAFAEALSCFAPEGTNLGPLDQITVSKDENGYFANVPDPLPKADPGSNSSSLQSGSREQA